ncbi:zinc finger transcriptional activator [Collariella sp. IMI 366227]|nr:zinc finger transcriptional activator [Collariella sp. IMI 366227]
MSQPQPTARSRIISAQLHNAADALDLLTFTAAREQNKTPRVDGPASASNNPTPSEVAAGDALLGLREPPGEMDWDKFILIRKGVLTKSEATEYLDFYFDVMWSLRPVVHPFYRERSRYGLLLAEEPLLSISLLTLSSRYHMLSGSHGEIRSERIHWQAWKFLRRYLHSALWGSPYTRSPGAIAAMLLMIEWHSKAINNPAAFSEEEDGDMFSASPASRRPSFGTKPGQITSLTSQERYGMATLLESLNIVAPAYRSNKMSWMLLSTAIALAQEGCCFDYFDAQASTGPPASEQELCKQQWNQLICVFVYLADENLAMRLGLNPLLPERSSEVVRNRYSTTFAAILPDTALWESYYDLAAETKKATLLLESLKKGQAPLLSAVLDLEYHYSVMYSFAPAYSALQHHLAKPSEPDKTPSDPLDPKVAALTSLADQATHASHQILSIVVNVMGPSNLGRYLPLLRASTTAIRNASPDDTHMANRYARFLEILLNASLRSTTAASSSSRGQSPAPNTLGVQQQLDAVSVGGQGPIASVPAAAGGGGGAPVGGAVAGEDPDWWTRYSVMASAAGLDTIATLNLSLPSGLAPQIGRDPFSWWDGAFGMTGVVGFQ